MDEIVLTSDDNGCTISADIGDVVRIVLSENPTTGYTWEKDGQLSSQLKESASEQKKTHKKSLGGAGKRILSYTVIEKGTCTLSLKYWQPWSGEESVSERFKINFEID